MKDLSAAMLLGSEHGVEMFAVAKDGQDALSGSRGVSWVRLGVNGEKLQRLQKAKQGCRAQPFKRDLASLEGCLSPSPRFEGGGLRDTYAPTGTGPTMSRSAEASPGFPLIRTRTADS